MRGKDVVVEYRGGLKALWKASFQIPGNKVTCLMGPNASGKTTLLRAVARLVEYRGSILIDGLEASRMPLAVLSKILSYGSPTSVSTSLSLRVREILEMALYPLKNIDVEKAVEEASMELDITMLLDRYVGELSSGELQRVVIASALVKNPRYLLLDEPDAHVDVGFKPVLSRVLRRRAASSTIVVATHDPVFASCTCDHVIVLRSGSIVFEGGFDELLENLGVLEETYGVGFTVSNAPNGRRIILPYY